MKCCCIFKCRNCKYNDLEPIKGSSLFSFEQNDEYKQEWVRIINSIKGQFLRKNKKLFYICDLHFDKSFIIRNKSKARLMRNAIPTIFPSVDGTDEDPLSNVDYSIDICGDIANYLETVISTRNISPTSIPQRSTQSIAKSMPKVSTPSISKSMPKVSTPSISKSIPQRSTQIISKSVPQRSTQSVQQRTSQSIQQNIQQSTPQIIQQNTPQIIQQSTPQTIQKSVQQNIQQTTPQIIPDDVPHCRYPGDIDISMACQDRKTAYIALKKYKDFLKKERNEVKVLRQFKKRQETKLKALRDIVQDLETKISVSQNAISHIKEINNWTTSDLIKELRNGLHGPHKDELRAFVTRVLMSFV